MKKALIKLIDVRSILTLAVTAVFCIMTVLGKGISQEFMTMYNFIITFYFLKQSLTDKKKEDDLGEKQSQN